ncbi:6-carboxytetrahydropterin synthase [Saccharibacter sp. 17.LH.SD]|uniref:6-carboxytetrahydropterin synthase n=1 Tax=Saccharibacter sp. 17.LH.SD TaxID=2689393 RepID=UPI0013691DED|nr:6-carboxytetrahydropterin synthase [Saccharibacter sp. 17.LH.SD]MXV45070.1 6-carboxytetrahydropterin synthase [Saccharibacter sp. 17.LH.SD]
MTDMAQTELVFTRRYSMGHRLISGASERCAIPHGHNEYVTVTLGAGPNNPHQRLDGYANMLLPFAEAKGRWHRFIDDHVDHCLQLSEHDPLLRWFADNEPQRLKRIIVTPGDPTTEMLAALLLAKLSAFLHVQGDVLSPLMIEIKETPTNTVRLRGNPQHYLPTSEAPLTSHWWNRADNTINDLSTP